MLLEGAWMLNYSSTPFGRLEWKHAHDTDKFVAPILIDMSKAYECLPHDILLSKLSAYGFFEIQ